MVEELGEQLSNSGSQNRTCALGDPQNSEDFLDGVTGKLSIFSHTIYELIDLGSTL